MKKTLIGLTLLASMAQPALAGSLENLERERANAVLTMLSPDISTSERLEKLEIAQYRLVDLERMVMRDDSIIGDTSPVVRVAFDNFDLTFLVHASTEQSLSVVDQWFDQVGLTTNAIMDAKAGRRGL